MYKERELKEVVGLITRWIGEIRLNNFINLYDINKLSEGLALKLLNILYSYELVDLNSDIRNVCAIDLGDEQSKIAFQVTSRVDSKKIKDTLEKFVNNELDKKYENGVRFLILNFQEVKLGKYKYNQIYFKFNKSEDIITDKKLIRDIEQLYSSNYTKFCKILELLSKSIGKSRNYIEVPDEEIFKKIGNCFDRPAFKTPFYLESNLPNFKKAIEDTIEAINTGVYRLRDNTIVEIIYPKSKIKDDEARKRLGKIVDKLIILRSTYDKLISDNEIRLCGCGSAECGVHLLSSMACEKMDSLRREILSEFRNIYSQFDVEFLNI
ncbi:SMEK domain-containing protein [Clostridium sp. WILCCON 0269]|uniref:SMEK domain-containing protein n=1 Tax=Candidatus Clostridium eludens TaxID=3381663 RepID=A0ABW8SJ26_9CLOT